MMWVKFNFHALSHTYITFNHDTITLAFKYSKNFSKFIPHSLLTSTISILLLINSQIHSTNAQIYLNCDTRNFSTACVTSSLTISSRDEKIVSSHTKIHELIIENAKVNFLPSNLAEVFPNLTRLEVINSGLLEVSESDLKFPKLSILDLSFNKLKKIGKIFRPKNLKILRLNGNEITEIHHEAFDELEDLQELKLDGNLCIHEDEQSVRLMIEEVKKNCSKTLMEKMTFLLGARYFEDPAVMVVIFVVILLVISIVVAVIARVTLDRCDYEVKQIPEEIFIDEIPREVRWTLKKFLKLL